MKDYLVYLALGIALLALLFSYKTNMELRNLYCDLGTAFMAERTYTYPILRQIDNPDNYGEDIKNPLTTDQKYIKYCL